MLTPYGDFEMRISTDIIRYLDSCFKNWRYVGLTQWYNHTANYRMKTVSFEIIPRLYAPALPFNQHNNMHTQKVLPNYFENAKCQLVSVY